MPTKAGLRLIDDVASAANPSTHWVRAAAIIMADARRVRRYGVRIVFDVRQAARTLIASDDIDIVVGCVASVAVVVAVRIVSLTAVRVLVAHMAMPGGVVGEQAVAYRTTPLRLNWIAINASRVSKWMDASADLVLTDRALLIHCRILVGVR